MTSINAMRLDFYSGILLCDETRCWNPEWLVLYTPDKIRSVVRQDIIKRTRSDFYIGITGTSSIGDEISDQLFREVCCIFEKKFAEIPEEKKLLKFLNVEEFSQLAFKVVTRLKKMHINDYVIRRFGFSVRDYIQGKYSKGEEEYQIKNEKITDKVLPFLTFDNSPEEVTGIFGNSQVMAGFDPESGFRIFYMTQRMPVCEEVQEIFLAQGSGRDSTDLVYSNFANRLKIPDKRDSVDRVEGLVAMLEGIARAFKWSIGIGGYPKIIYFDAREKDPLKMSMEISDKRAKLSLEIVDAGLHRFISWNNVEKFIDDLIFRNKEFFEVHEKMLNSVNDPKKLLRFLRGYKVKPD